MERSEALGLPPELKSHRGPCFLVHRFLLPLLEIILLPLLGFSELTSDSSSELSMVLSNSLDSSSSPSG